mmetsp:Transcript_110002/g.267479  ORF Transcript_110002/g.267479 Transcript_110002/m.267479 type:complete len:225 (+) Transcript_110002:55-729(+)
MGMIPSATCRASSRPSTSEARRNTRSRHWGNASAIPCSTAPAGWQTPPQPSAVPPEAPRGARPERRRGLPQPGGRGAARGPPPPRRRCPRPAPAATGGGAARTRRRRPGAPHAAPGTPYPGPTLAGPRRCGAGGAHARARSRCQAQTRSKATQSLGGSQRALRRTWHKNPQDLVQRSARPAPPPRPGRGPRARAAAARRAGPAASPPPRPAASSRVPGPWRGSG